MLKASFHIYLDLHQCMYATCYMQPLAFQVSLLLQPSFSTVLILVTHKCSLFVGVLQCGFSSFGHLTYLGFYCLYGTIIYNVNHSYKESNVMSTV